MTRQEYSGERCLEFSRWIREECPDSSNGFMVTNQDWIFWNWKTRRLMLCEEKTRNGDISQWFRNLIQQVFHPALNRWCKKKGIEYRGYHLIQFSGTGPRDGDIYFDRVQISDQELKQILSFEIYPPAFNAPNVEDE